MREVMQFDENWALQRAIDAGKKSHCAKSKRGVVIWHPGTPVYVGGCNHQPEPFVCDGSDACKAACGKLCVHAEAHAIQHAMLLRSGRYKFDCLITGADMLHVKVVDGEAVPSGNPSCWQCSRLILDSGIAKMWLLHEEGLKDYSALDFHRLTLEHHGLFSVGNLPSGLDAPDVGE